MIQFLVGAGETVIRIGMLNYFMPIFMFLFVFALTYALITKTKILGEQPFTNVLVSFVVAIIFIATPAAVKFTNIITPWLVVFFIALFFIFLIIVWLGGEGGMGLIEVTKSPFISWGVVIVLIAIFIYAGIQAFGPILAPYAPGVEAPENATAASEIGFQVREVIFHPSVLGISLLFLIAAVTAWVLGQKVVEKVAG